ncbi:MAG: enoyl-CoA hydratase [Rhodospirillaceae bacterium]|nr:MAG: enoyl-CoA hydratase [Rhodospirillaceae bacterium]
MTVRFNRPDKRNSVTMDMYAAMAQACQAADADPKVRVVVFTANGDVFCAGNDLKDFLTHSLDDPSLPVYQFMRALSSLRKPTIAAVNGAAIGIGATMLMHCDFVYATPNARFQLPFVNLAIVPEFASSMLLARLVGARRATELLLLGESFTAERALADGFINEIIPADHMKATVTTKVRALASQPPGAMRETKRLIRADIGEINARMEIENKALGERVKTPELKEAVQAFFEKRAPDYSKFE